VSKQCNVCGIEMEPALTFMSEQGEICYACAYAPEDAGTKPLSSVVMMAAGAVAASYVVSMEFIRTVNGEIVAFKDWGAVVMGAVAVLLGLLTFVKKDFGSSRGLGMGVAIGAILLGAFRVVYGLGLFI